MSSSPVTRAGMHVFQKAVLGLVGATLATSVGARMLLHAPSKPSSNPLPDGARSFVAEAAADHPEHADRWTSLLPFVTEASLFALIGFALGYTTRKAIKLLLIAIAIAFVTVQVLVARGAMTVDWGGVVHAIQAWVLNMHPDVPVADFLRKRVPTAIAFATCWFVGFRRG